MTVNVSCHVSLKKSKKEKKKSNIYCVRNKLSVHTHRHHSNNIFFDNSITSYFSQKSSASYI